MCAWSVGGDIQGTAVTVSINFMKSSMFVFGAHKEIYINLGMIHCEVCVCVCVCVCVVLLCLFENEQVLSLIFCDIFVFVFVHILFGLVQIFSYASFSLNHDVFLCRVLYSKTG